MVQWEQVVKVELGNWIPVDLLLNGPVTLDKSLLWPYFLGL